MSKKNDASFALPDKSYLLQNAKMFHQQINSRKCRLLISKCLLYMNNQGSSSNAKSNQYYDLTADEQTQLFFGASKLFHCKEYQLRQIVYILMMELSNAKDTIIMTNLLTKDIASTYDELFGKPVNMNSISLTKDADSSGPPQNLVHTSNALKSLSKIIDPSLLQAFERFYTTCLVDKHGIISSSAICSAYILYPFNKDIVKKWSNLIQDQINASDFTCYHALGVLYLLKQHDPISILKLSTSHTSSITGPWSLSMLCRIVKQALLQEYLNTRSLSIFSNPPYSALFDFLQKCLGSKYDMVSLQAVNAITSIVMATNGQLPVQLVQPLITQCSLFLSSSKLPCKYASLNNLNSLSSYYPTLISNYNIDIEHLITDPNTVIATFAITTLLKTGTESSVDRLMTLLGTYLSLLNEDYKIIIVDAISKLSLTFPKKQGLFITFLSGVLREEGAYAYKSSVIGALSIILSSSDTSATSVNAVLASLSEFIEDCEFTTLSTRVLHLLATHGPLQPNPQQYIKYIYNRIILESSHVRAAALHALYAFGQLPLLRDQVVYLLRQGLHDLDNEVRDRSLLFLRKLELEQPTKPKSNKSTLVWDLNELDSACQLSLSTGTPLDVSMVSFVPLEQPKILQAQQELSPVKELAVEAPVVVSTNPTDYIAQLPQLSTLMPHYFTSSHPVFITEAETEYVVRRVVHVFKNDAILIEFNIKNTLVDVHVSQAVVQLETGDSLALKIEVPCGEIKPNGSGLCVLGYMKQPGQLVMGQYTCKLKMMVHDCDPATLEIEDDKGYEETVQVI